MVRLALRSGGRERRARRAEPREATQGEIGPEGNPLALAEKRTLSFSNRKIIVASTPLLEDRRHVFRAYGQSDQRVFEVRCPECGAFTEIMWQHIEWPEGEPERAPLAPAEGRRRPEGEAWGAVAKRVGIGKSIAKETGDPYADRTVNDLRGTAVTRLSEAGCTPQEIRPITGHTIESTNLIIEHHCVRTDALAGAAILKLEKHRG